MFRRWIVIAVAILLGLIVAAARFARGGFIYVSPMEAGEAVHQMEALQQKLRRPLRIIGIDLDTRRTRVELQNPDRPEVADRWEVSHFRARRGLIDWTHVSGPEPVQSGQTRLPVQDLVFSADQVDFAAVAPLAGAAISQVKLEEAARVTEMHLGKGVILIPYEHAGRLGWSVDVHSAHEYARAFADPAGRITELNLDGTLRAHRLNLYDGGQPLLDIAHQFSAAFDGKESIHSLVVYRDSFRAKMVDPRDPTGVATYSSSLNGVFRDRMDDVSPRMPELPADPMGVPDPPFAIGEVDWTAVPRLVQAARDRLDMRESRVTLLDIRKRARALGPPTIEWDIDLTAPSGQSASLVLDTAGHVLDGHWPRGREPSTNMLEPAMAAQFMAALRAGLDAHTAVIEIVLRSDEGIISLRDPRDPHRILDLKYTGFALEKSFMPPSKPGTWMGQPYEDDWFVELGTIDDAVLAALPVLEQAALDRLHIPGGRVEAVTLGRHAMILEDNRQLVAEVSVKGDDGADGRVYFDLRGRPLRTD